GLQLPQSRLGHLALQRSGPSGRSRLGNVVGLCDLLLSTSGLTRLVLSGSLGGFVDGPLFEAADGYHGALALGRQLVEQGGQLGLKLGSASNGVAVTAATQSAPDAADASVGFLVRGERDGADLEQLGLEDPTNLDLGPLAVVGLDFLGRP